MAKYDSPLKIEEVFNRKDPSLAFKVIPQNDESFICSTTGRWKGSDSTAFLKLGLDTIVIAMLSDDFIHSKKVNGDKVDLSFKRLTYHDEYFERRKL